MRRVVSEPDLRQFQERVCAAATELLAERGYEGFKMRELAARLGVSAMTTYRYFESKNDIFAALRAQAFNALADRLEQLLDPAGPPFERLMAFCRGYLDFAREEPVRYRLMFDHSLTQMAGSADVAGAQRRMFQALTAQAHICAASGRREQSPEQVAQNLWASLHGLASLTLMEAVHEHELHGLLLDISRRFAAPGGRPAELKAGLRDCRTELRPSWSGRSSDAISDWIPISVAD